MPNAPKTIKDLKGQPRRSEYRGTRKERGYDEDWLRLRSRYLAAKPTCNDCRRLATEVHHIKPIRDYPELRLVWENLMGLCKSCHSKRTARGE